MPERKGTLGIIWGQVYLNGRLVSADEAAVSVFDRGLLYGDGIYETIRVYGGTPFMLDAHIRRMAHGSAAIDLPAPDADMLREGVRLVLTANGLSDAYLRITVTRGATGEMWFDTACADPTVLIVTRPFVPRSFEDGLSLIISGQRTDERSPLSGVKQIGILPKILARAEASRAEVDDALLLDTQGFVSEATSSNCFWVRDGKLFTPSLSCGILAGITRDSIIRVAQADGIEVIEGEFALDELLGADEVFLTSSTWETAQVRSIGDVTFQAGPMTAHIGDLFREYAQRRIGEDHEWWAGSSTTIGNSRKD